jgi:hypothetical protein
MEIGCLEKCLARLFPFCRHLEEREVTLVGIHFEEKNRQM